LPFGARSRGSVEERPLHTRKVAGSIPAGTTLSELHEHGLWTPWLVRFVRFLSGDRCIDRFSRRMIGRTWVWTWRFVPGVSGSSRGRKAIGPQTTSVVGGTQRWWGVGIEPSGYGVGVAAGGNFRGAQLSATER
jgi:hypothetical protein